MKNNKPVWSYFLIGVMLALFVSICVCFIVISTGYVDTKRLVVYSGSAEKAYDDSPLTNSDYGIKNGKLKDGHTLLVTTYGTQTEVGASFNYFHYTIVDQTGTSVTKEYRIIEAPGVLIVHEEGWIDWEKLDKLKDYIDRFDNVDLDAAGLDLSDMNLEEMIKDIDWDSLPKEEQEEKLKQLAAMIAAASSGNPEDLEQLLEQIKGGENGGEGSGGATGGSGRFDSNLQESGNGLGDDPDKEILKIKAERSGDYYLRYESFGDYNGRGFEQAEVYDNGIVSPLYFSGYAISQNNPYSLETVGIENLDGSGAYYLPYYAITGVSEESGDVCVSKKSDKYQLRVSSYDYLNTSWDYTMLTQELNALEEKYREYVYGEYLTIDQSLKDSLVEMTDFSSSGKQLVRDIKDYVQNAATYNLNHGKFPDGEDMVLYFLQEGKEGICQHFSAAATMMFRAYGIPARYTCGYKATAIADEWTPVTAKFGHAWVEIYVDGLGWVYVEVTGSAYDQVRKNEISIESISASQVYDGKPFDEACGWTVTSGRLLTGHQIIGVCEDGVEMPKYVGEYLNDELSYKIVDGWGKDVTNWYIINDITYGSLTITKRELTVYAGSASYEYTGSAISHPVVDFTKSTDIAPNSPDEPMPGRILSTDDYIYVTGRATATEIGTYNNVLSYYILDADGIDVYDQYILDERNGTLEITRIKIDVITADYDHQYDGGFARKEKYEIASHSQEKILPQHNHRAVVGSTVYSISEIGQTAENRFDVIFYDTLGRNITSTYYELNYDYGELEVIKRQIQITTGSDEQVDAPASNSNPQKVVNLDPSLDALLSGHTLKLIGTAPVRVELGYEKNDCKYTVVDSLGRDVSSYYEISYDDVNSGILRVYRTITIETSTAEFDYDYRVKHSSPIPNYTPALEAGHTLVPITFTEKTDPGTYENVCTYKVVDSAGKDITDEYYVLQYAIDDDGKRVGRIIIKEPTNRKEITISVESAEKYYDGNILTVQNPCTLLDKNGNPTQLETGHELIVTYSQGITNVGEVNCVSTFRIICIEGGVEYNVTPLYKVTLKGKLTVKPIEITYSTQDVEYTSWESAVDGVFMGDESSVTVKVTAGNLEQNGFTYDIIMTGVITVTEVEEKQYCEVLNTAKIVLLDSKGNEINSKNYVVRAEKYNDEDKIGYLSVVIFKES